MIILRCGWFRHALKNFEREINFRLEDGYKLEWVEISSGIFGLRWFMLAELKRPDDFN